MAALRRTIMRTPRGMNGVPDPSPSVNDNPTDSGNTAVLNAVLELKESFGGVRSDIQHLKDEVSAVQSGQKETNKRLKAVEDFQSTLKIWGGVIGGIFALFIAVVGAAGNWDKFWAFLCKWFG